MQEISNNKESTPEVLSNCSDDVKTSRLVLRHSPAAHVITNDDFKNIETERTKNCSSHSNSRGDSV
jgi:hypothetical protein